jgi:hypothetical protein
MVTALDSIPSELGASAMQPNAAPVGGDASPQGWRDVPVRYPDGTLGYREEPLAPDAFLDPQEGDHVIHGTEHDFCVHDLAVRLRHHFRNDSTRAVDSEVKMNGASPGSRSRPRTSPCSVSRSLPRATSSSRRSSRAAMASAMSRKR